MKEDANLSQEAEEASRLVKRIREGDRDAFQELVRAHQQKVFQLAYAFFGNREDALDIVQETFLRLHQKIGTYREGWPLHGWVLQIAKNICVDFFRRNAGRRKFEAGVDPEDLQIPAEERDSARRTSDLKDLLSRSIRLLADRQRTVFIMRHCQEYAVDDIARMLNISPGTVKSLHFKAVRNLKNRLSPYLGVTE